MSSLFSGVLQLIYSISEGNRGEEGGVSNVEIELGCKA